MVNAAPMAFVFGLAHAFDPNNVCRTCAWLRSSRPGHQVTRNPSSVTRRGWRSAPAADLARKRRCSAAGNMQSSLHQSADTVSEVGGAAAWKEHVNPQPARLPKRERDTIFALSTGSSGAAGVAVIRISGPRASDALEALTTPPQGSAAAAAAAAAPKAKPSLPAPRRAVVRRLWDPRSAELLDEALVLWMPAPRSFTGEDTVELHTHGSRAVVAGVLDALGNLFGPTLGGGVYDGFGSGSSGSSTSGGYMRPAERGEFTQRAYGNGRMDLTAVEGLADLLAADTAAQRRQALRQMGGALSARYGAWRAALTRCLAHTEAVIDFGDDEDDAVDSDAWAALRPQMESLISQMEDHLNDGRRGEIVRDGIRVAIVGPPNAGKSSLLNLLAARPAAIVSAAAGTTRDVVEVRLDLAGFPVVISDTAGLRGESAAVAAVTPGTADGRTAGPGAVGGGEGGSGIDPVEWEGMRRARAAAAEAQLVLFVLDASDARGDAVAAAVRGLWPADGDAGAASGSSDGGTAARDGVSIGVGDDESPPLFVATENVLVVANKVDLLGNGGRSAAADAARAGRLCAHRPSRGGGRAALRNRHQ
ncbi:unnamed protein product [Phaeothamnion confervicola]